MRGVVGDALLPANSVDLQMKLAREAVCGSPIGDGGAGHAKHFRDGPIAAELLDYFGNGDGFGLWHPLNIIKILDAVNALDRLI